MQVFKKKFYLKEFKKKNIAEEEDEKRSTCIQTYFSLAFPTFMELIWELGMSVMSERDDVNPLVPTGRDLTCCIGEWTGMMRLESQSN